MADLTKIVPSTITSTQAVSEVNGISLTKSKQNAESTLPSTTFAEILEAQLSQNNLQTDETQIDTKQILPGQSVEPSLFGSLIVVVRDVEVPISEAQDNSIPKENNRLFAPTIFTASTSSAISVSEPPTQTAKEVSSRNIEPSITNEIQNSSRIVNTLQHPTVEQIRKESIQSESSTIQENPKITNPEFVETSQNENTKEAVIADSVIPSQASLVVPVTTIVTNQPIVSSAPTNGTIDESVPSVEYSETFVPVNVTTSKNQFNEVLNPNSQKSESNQVTINRTEALSPVPKESISGKQISPTEKTVDQVSSTKQVTETSSRTLSSMLQSVQGLKMGIERTPTQQTFITVALPISEVQRLVVANPEIFVPKEQGQTISTNKNTVDNVAESTNEKEVSSVKRDVLQTPDLGQTLSQNLPTNIVQTTTTENSGMNRDDLFVPTIFASKEYSEIPVSSSQQDKPIVMAPNISQADNAIQAPVLGKSSTPDTTTVTKTDTKSENNNTVFQSQNIEVKEFKAVPFSTNSSIQNENTSVSNNTDAPKQNSIEKIAKTIENFATNLQTISSPKLAGNESQMTSISSKSFVKETNVSPFTATIETISEKRTLIIEPIQKEIVPQPTNKVEQYSEPKNTISQLLQKAEKEGMAIESIVVKIPVQATKNTEVQKQTISVAQPPIIPSTLTPITPQKDQNVVVSASEKKPTLSSTETFTSTTIQSGKQTSLETYQTPIQNEKASVSVVGKENLSVKNTVSTPQIVQNDTIIQNTVSKETNTVQTEANTNKKSEQERQPARKDVSSILQRVENIQQKSTANEVKNLTPTTVPAETNATTVPIDGEEKTTFGVKSISPDLKPAIEFTPKQAVEIPSSFADNISLEKENLNESLSSTISGIASITKPTIPLAPTTETNIVETPVTIEELPKAIVQEFVTTSTEKGSKASFTLNPEQLGTVQVEVSMKGNTASITLESSQKETIPMLEKQIDTLKEQMKTSNIVVEKLEVLFKPTEVVLPTTTMNDTFTSSQQMEQQSMQQEIDRQAQQQRKNQQETPFETENSTVEEIQPKRFGDGSSIIEEYI